MKKKLIFLSLLTVISVNIQASWWGDMSNAERASVIATGVLLTNDRYNRYYGNEENSEARHQAEMKELENRLRKEYEEKEKAKEQYVKKPNPNKPVIIEEQPIIVEREIPNNKYQQRQVQIQQPQGEEALQISPEELKALQELAPQVQEEQ